MPALLPSYFASQALFSTYYLALADDYDPVKPNMTAFETAEMEAALALVPRDEVTKLFAVVSGSWNTAGNWYPSGVPGANAKVCIPEGCTVTTGPDDDTTDLLTVRLDGNFHPDPTVDMAILFDTWIGTPTSSRRSGIRTNRVPQGKTHRYIISTSRGDIDADGTDYFSHTADGDTFVQSRGMIEMGVTEDWGAVKTPFFQVAAYTGPAAAATSLTLESTPTNWQIGDEIVICATHETGTRWNGFQNTTEALRNEKRTITNISGAVVTWSGGLTWDHIGFAATAYRPEFKCYVANLTRNVIVEPDDDDAPIHHRGHTMQMHNWRGGSAHYKRFRNLGRTAKLGGWAGRIIWATSADDTTPDTDLDLTASPHWNGSSIVLSGKSFNTNASVASGPSFKLSGYFAASDDGNMTVDYTDEAGDPQTLVYPYLSTEGADTIETIFSPWMKSIESIQFSTALVKKPFLFVNAASRQVNQSGVRDMHSSFTSGDWTYTAARSATNAQGRYPAHWHKMGLTGYILENPPVFDGCVFDDSPGWGFAHHQTHGDIRNCVAYNHQGAGLVAEDGNETGLWFDSISIGAIGNDDITHKWYYDFLNKDPARSGAAMWFTGRMVRAKDLVCAGSLGGFVYNIRLEGFSLDSITSKLDQPTSVKNAVNPHMDYAPVGHFEDCEAFACEIGLITVRANSDQNHDLRTVLRDFHAWSVTRGMELTYTINYTMIDCLTFGGWISDGAGGFSAKGNEGFSVGTNTSAQVVVGGLAEGFNHGFGFDGDNFTSQWDSFKIGEVNEAKTGVHTYGLVMVNNTEDYHTFRDGFDFVLPLSALSSVTPSLDVSTITKTSGSETRISGTKTDEIGERAWPFGLELYFQYGPNLDGQLIGNNLATYGYYVSDSVPYLIVDEWFSSGATGILYKIRLPIDVSSYTLTGYTNHGTIDLSNNTAPVLADFSVSVTRNTPIVIDIVGRATSAVALTFGGFVRPMKGFPMNNGDGTITYTPLANENYTESFPVWVDDVNGNTTRATMTINVNKRALYLGRQDLL